jgi:hypothetical protein
VLILASFDFPNVDKKNSVSHGRPKTLISLVLFVRSEYLGLRFRWAYVISTSSRP